MATVRAAVVVAAALGAAAAVFAGLLSQAGQNRDNASVDIDLVRWFGNGFGHGDSARTRTRTGNLRLKGALLYLLSYARIGSGREIMILSRYG